MVLTTFQQKEDLNIVEVLARRELGLESPNRRYKRMLRGVVLSRDWVNVNEKPIVSHGSMKYGAGRLLVRNGTNRTVDCLDLRRSSVRSNNYLERYSLNTGKLMFSQFLSNKNRYKEISFDLERGWMMLSSVKKSDGSDVLMSFIILDRLTLDFLYQFELKRSVFGSDILDAQICYGLLLTIHTNKLIRFYSVEEILKISSKKVDNYSDKMSQVETAITILDLTLLPTCLLEVRSHHHHLEMMLNPWVYIKAATDNKFSLHRLSDHCQLEGGQISSISQDAAEEEHTMFHPDESPRLIHFGGFGLHIHRLMVMGREKWTVENEFNFNSVELEDPPNRELSSTTSSGSSSLGLRGPRRKAAIKNVFTYAMEETMNNITFCYEDELDIFAILHSADTLSDDDSSILTNVKSCKLYDNKTMKLLRTLSLDIIAVRSGLDTTGSVGVILDQDLLLVSFKNSSRSTVQIYKATEQLRKEEK